MFLTKEGNQMLKILTRILDQKVNSYKEHLMGHSGIFAYMRPNSKTMSERDKVISLFYSVMTSMLNPIIYSLRNKDVKGALRKLAGR